MSSDLSPLAVEINSRTREVVKLPVLSGLIVLLIVVYCLLLSSDCPLPSSPISQVSSLILIGQLHIMTSGKVMMSGAFKQ